MLAFRRARKSWRPLLLGVVPVVLLVVMAVAASSGAANANLAAAVPARPPVPGSGGQPLEGGPPVPPAPYYTAPPSAHVLNDPHWRSPNVRANTDATTFAQQE